MFRWIREAFGHPRGGVHTRIATFRPKAPPPDPRPVEVEFTGRELYSFPEGTSERILEESAALSVRMERARRAFEAPYGTGRIAFERAAKGYDPARYDKERPYAGNIYTATFDAMSRQLLRSNAAAFERMAEEHDADRFDAASL